MKGVFSVGTVVNPDVVVILGIPPNTINPSIGVKAREKMGSKNPAAEAENMNGLYVVDRLRLKFSEAALPLNKVVPAGYASPRSPLVKLSGGVKPASVAAPNSCIGKVTFPILQVS